MNIPIIKDLSNNSNPSHNCTDNVDVAALLRFMHHMKIPNLLGQLPDRRQQSKTAYSLQSLALWALSACIFRQGSKNALHSTLEGLSVEQREGILQFLGTSGDKLPHYTTVDDALAGVDYDRFNQILLTLFKDMNSRKFFYQHADALLPDDTYHLGTDGFHLHTYTEPHAMDEQRQNICPYCLPRTSHAGTAKEVTRWVHVVVTFVFICEEFKVPIFVYPLKAQQIKKDQSDEKFKQECELTAAHDILPMIRKRFPRLHFTFLGDALYANRPFMRLCDSLKMDYIIVHKKNTLKLLSAKCDEFAKLSIYQTAYSHEQPEGVEGKKMAMWFNYVDIGDGYQSNVLRFQETKLRATRTQYSGEWLCSRKLSKSTCFRRAERGRMRWHQEDLHNTCKNRGFDIQHDMARADPNLLMVWKLLMFIAFFIFELFALSAVGKKARGKRSLMKFARDMLQQLVYMLWAQIRSSPILQQDRVQFRFMWNSS